MKPPSYPEPPWVLRASHAFAWVGLGDAAAARAALPVGLEPMLVPGGHSLQVIAAARYGEGSTLAYSELIAGVLAKAAGRWGLFVLGIYVDDDRARRAGWERWAMPKERAAFQWEEKAEPGTLLARDRKSYQLEVRQGDQLILNAWWLPRGPRFRLRRGLPAFSARAGRIAPWEFAAQAAARLAVRHLEVPERSPLAPWVPGASAMLHLADLVLEVPEPGWQTES